MPINALQYDKLALIDTSAVIALFDPTDRFHKDATILFDSAADLVWFTLNATTHRRSLESDTATGSMQH